MDGERPQGNLGLSLEYQRPNTELIGERLVLTVILALFSFVFTWLVAIPIGIYSATHPRSVLDYAITVLNYVGVATPNFMLALILMWIAFAYLGISATGLFSPEFVDAPWSAARVLNLLAHIWLPAGGPRGRRHRAPHPRDAGEPPRRATQALRRHRAGQGPVRVAAGPPVSRATGAEPSREHDRLVPPGPLLGSLIVATVMNIPNIGPLLLRALINQDMYLAGSILLIYCFLAIVGTLVSDILLAWIDPRIRLED
jgi:peptide/nickel transport system permease protein